MAAPLPAADPTAVFGRRVVAALIDAALVIVPALLVLTASFEYLDVAQLGQDPQAFCDAYIDDGGVCVSLADVNDRVYFTEGIGGGAAAVYWGGTFALLVVVQGLTGATLGKLLTGIRTVDEQGGRPGLGRALVRWLLWIVDAFPYIVPLLGFIVGLTTQGHRRVGDMVAKTYVVHRSAAGSPVAVPGVPTAGLAAPLGPPPDAAPAAPGPTLSPSGPQWDPARNTYIQWDPDQALWFQWDESTRAWTPITGA